MARIRQEHARNPTRAWPPDALLPPGVDPNARPHALVPAGKHAEHFDELEQYTAHDGKSEERRLHDLKRAWR